MPRKSSGAQPGNTNARKHGFYAGALSCKQKNVLRRAANIDPAELSQEVALLRSRIYELVNAEPDNLHVLNMSLRTLLRLVAINEGLSAAQENEIHQSLRDLIQDLAPAPEGAA